MKGMKRFSRKYSSGLCEGWRDEHPLYLPNHSPALAAAVGKSHAGFCKLLLRGVRYGSKP